MPDALTIDFALTGSDKVTAFFGRLASLSNQSAKSLRLVDTAASSAARSYRSLNAEIEKYNRLTSGGGSGPAINIGTGSPRASSLSARPTRFVSGPFQRQETLRQQMMGATATGNGRAEADIALAQARNNKQIDRVMSGPKGLGARFMDVLKTSRFGVGAGGKMEMMPLVGRTAALAAEALGPQIMALAGPVGLVVGGLTAASSAAFALARNAAELGTAFASRGFAVGNLGAGGSLAGMVGGDDAAAKANAFNDAITSGGIGQAFGLQLGQFNIAGPMGKIDKGSQYAAAVVQLREKYKQSPELAMRLAAGTNLTSSLPMAMMSDKQFAHTGMDAAAQSRVMDPKMLQQSIDYENSMSRTKVAFDNLGAALGAPLLGPLSSFANGLAEAVNFLSGGAKKDSGTSLTTYLEMLGGGPLGALAAVRFGGRNDKPDEAISGKSAHTEATDKNTKALDNLAGKIPGDYGSDPQGRRAAAMPTAAGRGSSNGPMGTRDSYVHGAFRLGAFA